MVEYAYPTEQQLDGRLTAVEQELKELKESLKTLTARHADVQGQADNLGHARKRSVDLQNKINGALARAAANGGMSGLSQRDLDLLREIAKLNAFT